MGKLKIGILFGGKSGEHEVSVVSAMGIYKALDKKKYDVTLIGIDKTGRWTLPEETKILAQAQNPRLIRLNDIKNSVGLVPYESKSQIFPTDGSNQKSENMDVIFPILHGTYGEDGTVQGLLELANLPYVGSGVLGSAVGMDKDMAKRVLRDAHIPVVPFMTLKKHDFKHSADALLQTIAAQFGYPYFVKPANMGSSVGVHKVKSAADAKAKLENAFMYDTKVLIEKAINARELECAVLGNHDPKASIVGEIIPNHEFYTYEAKYMDDNGADLKIPAQGLSQETMDEIRRISVEAFKALECRGLARVDFFYDKDTKKVYLNEINTMPGFTPISMYPKLWEATGISYSNLLDNLIELALEAHREKNSLSTTFEPA